MKKVLALILAGSMATLPSMTFAQANPPAVVVNADVTAQLLAACRAGNCAALVQQLAAQGRAAGMNAAAVKSLMASVAAALVQIAQQNPELAAAVAGGLNTVGEEVPTLAASMAAISEQVAAGNADQIDLTAVAQAGNVPDAGPAVELGGGAAEEAPAAAVNASPS